MSSLPVELWDIIMDHVSESTPIGLLACARVCRSLHPRAIAKFYESIRVDVSGRLRCNGSSRPPLLSAAAFSLLLDSCGSALYSIHMLQFHVGASGISDHLAGMTLPSDHRITCLCVRGRQRLGLAVTQGLRFAENFSGVVSLDLMTGVESTSLFTTALAQFPLLRRLAFLGTITLQDSRNGLTPPIFSQPCDLTVTRMDPFTWHEICRWALLDLARFGGLVVDLLNPEIFFNDFLRRQPDISPLIRDMHVSYMGNAQETWPDLDVGLDSLTRLKILRLEASSDRCTDDEASAALVKVADVAQRQARIAPYLRDLHVSAIEYRQYQPNDSYASDKLDRLVTELAHLGPRLRVYINLRWIVYPRPVGSVKESLDAFFATFAASCMLRFPVVEWTAYGCLTAPDIVPAYGDSGSRVPQFMTL